MDNYIPEQIKHRENEISMILKNTLPFFRGIKAPNILMFGITGTGKTLVAKYIGKYVDYINVEKKTNVKYIYVNCRFYGNSSSFYYILKYILTKLTNIQIKDGIRTIDMIEMLFEYLVNKDKRLILVLDEIDFMIKNTKKDDFIYLLTRDDHIIDKNRIIFYGISNNLSFLDHLDSRTRSSLNAIKIPFKPYNAKQLFDILKDRSILAFEEGAVSESILNYIAARVAKESGDARKAIAILRIAGQIAESKNSKRIEIEHVEEAFEYHDVDILISAVQILPSHLKLLILAILLLQLSRNEEYISLSEIYDKYVELSKEFGLKPLGRDSINKKIKYLEMVLGDYIETYIKSFGKGGLKKLVRINMDSEKINKLIKIIKENI